MISLVSIVLVVLINSLCVIMVSFFLFCFVIISCVVCCLVICYFDCFFGCGVFGDIGLVGIYCENDLD